MQKLANCLAEKIAMQLSSSCFSLMVVVVLACSRGRAGRGMGAEMTARQEWTPRIREKVHEKSQQRLFNREQPEARQLGGGGGVVDHSLVKKYFLEMYNKALRRAIMEQEAAAGEAKQPLDPLRRSSFNQAFGSAMKGKFGKEQYTGYNRVEVDELEEQERRGGGGVQAFAGGVEPFGGGHKHKHHHHKHSHEHTNEHEHEHKHLHEHEEEHKHKAKHQHVHKHEHHHEHNHHHKHKEEHEHEEEHKHEHSHEHAHKGGSWRRSSTDTETKSDFLVGKMPSKKPGVPLKEAISGGDPNASWEQEKPAAYPDEYQEIEYDWDL